MEVSQCSKIKWSPPNFNIQVNLWKIQIWWICTWHLTDRGLSLSSLSSGLWWNHHYRNRGSKYQISNYLTPSTRTIFRALLDDTVDDIHLLVTLPTCWPIDDPFIENGILEEARLQFVKFYERALSVYHLYVIDAKRIYLKKLMIDSSIPCRSQKPVEFQFQTTSSSDRKFEIARTTGTICTVQ